MSQRHPSPSSPSAAKLFLENATNILIVPAGTISMTAMGTAGVIRLTHGVAHPAFSELASLGAQAGGRLPAIGIGILMLSGIFELKRRQSNEYMRAEWSWLGESLNAIATHTDFLKRPENKDIAGMVERFISKYNHKGEFPVTLNGITYEKTGQFAEILNKALTARAKAGDQGAQSAINLIANAADGGKRPIDGLFRPHIEPTPDKKPMEKPPHVASGTGTTLAAKKVEPVPPP